MNQPYAHANQPYAMLTLASATDEVFGVQLYKKKCTHTTFAYFRYPEFGFAAACV